MCEECLKVRKSAREVVLNLEVEAPRGAAFAKASSPSFRLRRASRRAVAAEDEDSGEEIHRRRAEVAEREEESMVKTRWRLAVTRLRLANCRQRDARRGESGRLEAAPARLTFRHRCTNFRTLCQSHPSSRERAE